MSSETSDLTQADSLAQEKENPRGKRENLVRWRREKVWELKACGLTYDEIVESLRPKPGIKISHGTVARDLEAKQREINEGFTSYIEKELPVQHHLALTGLDRVIKESWRIYARAADDKTRLMALQTISTSTMQKQAVLGDPAMIEKAIKLVSKLREGLADKQDNGEAAHEDQGGCCNKEAGQ